MAQKPLNHVLQHVRKLVAAQTTQDLADRELLDRFVQDQDEAAFTALVERHGAMVLGVCRRVLRNVHDAEDACQAAFLVLARKAAAIRRKDSLGSWLHGVAYRVAGNVRRGAARRCAQEAQATELPQRDPMADVSWREVYALLDEELQRLPARYQEPLVLCYLEGKTRDEAAQQLGWSLGSLRGRLERGRELLRARLTRRGVSLSAALVGSALVEGNASGAVPAALVMSTVKAATAFAAGPAALAGVIPAHIAALTEGVLKTMMLTKLKIATAVLLVGFVTTGTGMLTYESLALAQPVPAQKAPPKGQAAPVNVDEIRAKQAAQDAEIALLEAVAAHKLAAVQQELAQARLQEAKVRHEAAKNLLLASQQVRKAVAPQSQDDELKNTLLALEKRRWEAGAKGDWTVQQELLDDDHLSISMKHGKSDKTALVEAAKQQRGADWSLSDVEARRVSKDVAILTYLFNCKVLSPNGTLLETCKDHRATLVWAQRNGKWLIVFCEVMVPQPQEDGPALQQYLRALERVRLLDSGKAKP